MIGGGTMRCMSEENGWLQQLRKANPEHSRWYIERFRAMAEAGADLAGEARLIDAMLPRGGRVLDAGCGTGRVGGFLAAAGHEVVGVDLDPTLIGAALAGPSGPAVAGGDLAELDLPAQGIADGFDVVVCAGNVMTFAAPGTRQEILRRFRRHLRAQGRAVVGFGAGRGYQFTDFLDDARAAGLVPDLLLLTWDVRPFVDDSDFLVASLRPQ